jgi:hypothetical protein
MLVLQIVPYLCVTQHIFVYICICVNQHKMENSYANNEVRGRRLQTFQHERHMNARHSEDIWIKFELFSNDIVEIEAEL